MMKNNPSFLTEDELKRFFVVRLTDFSNIIETIKENTDRSNQHILVIGPRGSGKTMLILRIVYEIRNDKELSKHWYPVVFGEESYEISTAAQFWHRAIYHLGEQADKQSLRDSYNILLNEKNDKDLYDRALARLMDFADEQGKRLLIVIENLNMLLGEQININDRWTLRHTLQNEPRIMLLGTATAHFGEVENTGEPLYELFRIHPLVPLNIEDCQALWEAITGKKVEYKKIRPLQILTGGNPRLLAIISSFAAGDSFKKLMDNLTHLIDEYTSYFKSNIETLPAIERKVFVVLAGIWEPATARQVAEEARINVNEASSLLKRLISRGAVTQVKDKGRKISYQVAERLYNIYYLMRRSHLPSDRVQAVVRFMVYYYEGEELAAKTVSLTIEACSLEPNTRQDHIRAFGEILRSINKEDDMYLIIKSTPREFFNLPDFDINILRVIYEQNNEARINREKIESNTGSLTISNQENILRLKLQDTPDEPSLWVHLGQIHTKLEKYQDAEIDYLNAIKVNRKYIKAWTLLGQLYEKLERYPEAEEAYRKAISIDPKNAWVWSLLGDLLNEKLERYPEAEEAYNTAINFDLNDSWTWTLLGRLYEKLERYLKAEEIFRKAIEIDPKYDWAWTLLGRLYEKLGRNSEAEKAYNTAIGINPNYAYTRTLLGQLHEKLERYPEAEEAYRKAIEVDPKYDWAWAHLGRLLHEKLDRYPEAEEAYRKAIAIDLKNDWAYSLLGDLLHEKLERYPEAEEAYRKAIEIDPKNAWAWAHLGRLLHEKLERYPEAEEAYRKAIEIDPKYAWAWTLLGQLYEKLERNSEAEEAYNTAIGVNPNYAYTRTLLGRLLQEKLERYPEAEEAYRKAIEIDPKYTWAWAHLGRLLHEKLGRYQEAEDAYRRAIEIDPKYAWAWAYLGWLLHEKLERYPEAEEAYRKAIEIDPKHAWPWAQFGILLHEKLGHYPEAEEAYHKVIQIEPKIYGIWYLLGILLEKYTNRIEEAEEAYRKAIEINPDYDLAQLRIIQIQIKQSISLNLIYNDIERYFTIKHRTAESLNEIAWLICENRYKDGYMNAEKFAQEAVKLQPDLGRFQYTLASIIAQQGRWKEALEIAPKFLKNNELGKNSPSCLVSFFTSAAFAGFAKEGLSILKQSPCAPFVEPLVVALQMLTNEEYNAPQEVVEVAKDIKQDIENKINNTDDSK